MKPRPILSLFIALSLFSLCCKKENPTETTNRPPAAPSNPLPPNAATGVSTSATLNWRCSDPDADSLTYDVFIGTSNPPTTKIAAGQKPTTLVRTGLANSTTYFWMVLANDSKGTSTTGPIWFFTTISPIMASVPAGTFMTGATSVTISTFIIDKFEVTYELWSDVRTWALAHGYTDLTVGQNGVNPIGTNNPVTNVNWYDIIKWCNARSEKEGFIPDYYTRGSQDTVYRVGQLDINIDAVKWNANGYRLPTETEWEFAARGGTSTHGYIYSGSNTLDSIAWYYSNSGSATHTVGTKFPNELGIFDMTGNAWEWCWDWFGSAYPNGGTTDPKGPSTTQTERTLRGSSFAFQTSCSVTYRSVRDSPDNRAPDHGFRCVQK